MFPHWEYVLHELFGRVTSVQALTATHIPQRWDEQDKPYDATADDAAYGVFELEGGAVAQINSSWAVRVNRDELVEFQVDGTEGSAVAGLRNCRVQHRSATPSRSGTPTSRPPTPSATSGRRSPTTPSSTTASRRSGSCSCGTCTPTLPTTGTSSRAPAASSSPNWG